jgi:hypothetical protein
VRHLVETYYKNPLYLKVAALVKCGSIPGAGQIPQAARRGGGDHPQGRPHLLRECYDLKGSPNNQVGWRSWRKNSSPVRLAFSDQNIHFSRTRLPFGKRKELRSLVQLMHYAGAITRAGATAKSAARCLRGGAFLIA